MIRFVHTSDLHLGKRFGNLPEDVRIRLSDARLETVTRLATLARDKDAPMVLVAGDVFDVALPAPHTVRQALEAMAAAPEVAWVLMPGNHDPAASETLWSDLAARRPDNVHLALAPEPIWLNGAAILPAPCPLADPGEDLTAWMAGAETGEAIRVGLAHGAIRRFGDDDTRAIIPPDRAESAGLDYLALGDWHGQVRIGPRCWYAGTPEADGFREEGTSALGSALVVDIAGRQAVPEIAPHAVGRFCWQSLDLPLFGTEDVARTLEAALPAPGARRQTLLSITASGRIGLAARDALTRLADDSAPDFTHFRFDDTALATVSDPDDLDAIERAGALRDAAEALLRATKEGAPADQATAESALSLLYAFAQQVEDA